MNFRDSVIKKFDPKDSLELEKIRLSRPTEVVLGLAAIQACAWILCIMLVSICICNVSPKNSKVVDLQKQIIALQTDNGIKALAIDRLNGEIKVQTSQVSDLTTKLTSSKAPIVPSQEKKK